MQIEAFYGIYWSLMWHLLKPLWHLFQPFVALAFAVFLKPFVALAFAVFLEPFVALACVVIIEAFCGKVILWHLKRLLSQVALIRHILSGVLLTFCGLHKQGTHVQFKPNPRKKW